MSEQDKDVVTVNVMLDRAGVQSVGQYVAGTVYQVEKQEADRLVKAKGFKVVTAAMAKKIALQNSKIDSEGES